MGTQEISRHTQILWKSMQYIAKVEKQFPPLTIQVRSLVIIAFQG